MGGICGPVNVDHVSHTVFGDALDDGIWRTDNSGTQYFMRECDQHSGGTVGSVRQLYSPVQL